MHTQVPELVLNNICNCHRLCRDLNRAKARAEQERLRQRLEEKARFAEST